MADSHNWTIETLKEHLLAIRAADDKRYTERADAQGEAVKAALASVEKALGAALEAQKEAVAKNETAIDKRFVSVNEFRATLADQQSSLITKGEAGAKFDALGEKISAISLKVEAMSNLAIGKDSSSHYIWSYILSGITTIGMVLETIYLFFHGVR